MKLKLDVVRFSNEDVITTSTGPLSGTSGLFYLPSSQYQDGALGSNFVYFNGTFGNFDGHEYTISNIGAVTADSQDERSGLMSGGTLYIPELGITVPSTAMEPIARQAYDAVYYYDGTYHTNGISYYDQYWQ